MFIFNIISKFPTIIYKPKFIYKTTYVPTNKDQRPHSNYYKYKFHWIHLHDHTLGTQQQAYAPLFLFCSYKHHYNIYLFYSPFFFVLLFI